MSSFLNSFKKIFRLGGDDVRKKGLYKNIKRDVDPMTLWDIVGELGDGAFGKVYKAQNKENRIFAALKQVEIKTEEDIEDYSVEIDILTFLTEIKDRNVVELLETFYFESKLWIFIEFCGAGALDSIMVDLEKPLTEPMIRYICHEMCLALVFLHNNKVIHRDLKAGNVLLTMDGEVKLADFGVSALNTKTLQRRDTFIGTPYWMAPEVILCETLKDEPYNYKADIWSLGITLIEFAQIEPPNNEMHPMRVLIKIQKADAPSLEFPHKWSKHFLDFLTKCLLKDPVQRPNAIDLLEHPFIKDYTDKRAVMDLICESKAEVVEQLDDLTEEEEIQEFKRNLSSGSRLSMENVSTDDEPEDRDVRKQEEKIDMKDEKRSAELPESKEPKSVTPEPESKPEKSKAPSPKKSPAPSPPITPRSTDETTPSEQVTEPEKEELKQAEDKEEQDKSSDEGLGPSSDERSEVSDTSQSESPAKIPELEDQKEDMSVVTVDILDEIIDDVMKSTTVMPSVPGVVLDTMQSVLEDVVEDEEVEEEEEEEEDLERPLGVGSIINKFERESSAEKTDVTVRQEERKGSVVEMEVQEIKVLVGDDEPVAETNADNNEGIMYVVNIDSRAEDKDIDRSVITINGQPVPEAGTIVLNGNITRIKDFPEKDTERGSDRPVSSTLIQQTDLDTFVTKVTTDVSGPGSVSNPDEDFSDQKSDTGSINTIDSLDKDQVPSTVEAPRKTRGHIRGRSQESKSQYRTMTKVRTYLKDGQMVTSTVQKVILAGEENKVREEHNIRKQDLRELKLLQKTENKQYQDLVYKLQVSRDAQERKFEYDMLTLVKNYDQDMDTLTKQQKQQVEKAEGNQALDMKGAAKRIKTEQTKEYTIFKEQQKQEMKLLKQEMDMMSKESKKDALRKRKEQKEIELAEKERKFMENQQERMDKHMKQLADTHHQKVALLESQFLQQKQQLLRAREAAIWELEKQQLHEKHQLAKSQLKDMFFLKRHQMLTRHQKEIEQMKRSNLGKEDEMTRRHAVEKKRLPKILKNEAKTRAQMFKQSLRLSNIGTPEDDRAKMKQFEENEKKRMKSEQHRQEQKHHKQWEELVFRNETSLRELEQLQGEKRKMLMEHETQKIKELDEQYSSELREWKAKLVPRKQKLEEEFARQKDEQEKFYGSIVMGNDGSSPQVQRSLPASLRKEDPLKSRHSTII